MKSILVSTTRVVCGAVLAAIIIMACSGNDESSGSVGALSSSGGLPDIFTKGKQIKTDDGKPRGEVVEAVGSWVRIKLSDGKLRWVNTNNPMWSWYEVEE